MNRLIHGGSANGSELRDHCKMEQATAIALMRAKDTADRAGQLLVQCVPQECDVTFLTPARAFNLLIFTATSSGSR